MSDPSAAASARRNKLKAYYGLAATPSSGSAQEEPASTITTTTTTPSNPLDSQGFDVDGYVQGMLRKGKLQDLLSQDAAVAREVVELDEELQMLVYGNYNNFINATQLISGMRTSVNDMAAKMDALKANITNIVDTHTDVQARLRPSREAMLKLVTVDSSLKKIDFLVQLPDRLAAALKEGKLTAVARYWSAGRAILTRNTHVKSFANVQSQCLPVVSSASAGLKQRLSEIQKRDFTGVADQSHDTLSEVAGHLVTLHADRLITLGDTDELDGHPAHAVKRIVYEAFLVEACQLVCASLGVKTKRSFEAPQNVYDTETFASVGEFISNAKVFLRKLVTHAASCVDTFVAVDTAYDAETRKFAGIAEDSKTLCDARSVKHKELIAQLYDSVSSCWRRISARIEVRTAWALHNVVLALSTTGITIANEAREAVASSLREAISSLRVLQSQLMSDGIGYGMEIAFFPIKDPPFGQESSSFASPTTPVEIVEDEDVPFPNDVSGVRGAFSYVLLMLPRGHCSHLVLSAVMLTVGTEICDHMKTVFPAGSEATALPITTDLFCKVDDVKVLLLFAGLDTTFLQNYKRDQIYNVLLGDLKAILEATRSTCMVAVSLFSTKILTRKHINPYFAYLTTLTSDIPDISECMVQFMNEVEGFRKELRLGLSFANTAVKGVEGEKGLLSGFHGSVRGGDAQSQGSRGSYQNSRSDRFSAAFSGGNGGGADAFATTPVYALSVASPTPNDIFSCTVLHVMRTMLETVRSSVFSVASLRQIQVDLGYIEARLSDYKELGLTDNSVHSTQTPGVLLKSLRHETFENTVQRTPTDSVLILDKETVEETVQKAIVKM